MRRKVNIKALEKIRRAAKGGSTISDAVDSATRRGMTPEAFIPMVDTRVPMRAADTAAHTLQKQTQKGIKISVKANDRDTLLKLKQAYTSFDIHDASRRPTPTMIDDLLSRSS